MLIVCAWCQKSLGEKPPYKDISTHGICPECKEKHFPEKKMTEEEKFDKLNQGILKAAGILTARGVKGYNLTEKDLPGRNRDGSPNWIKGRDMSRKIWAQVYSKGNK